MPLDLERVASRLRCLHCGAEDWTVRAEGAASPPTSAGRVRQKLAQRLGLGGAAEALTCRRCGARYRSEDGVLVLADTFSDPAVAREREAAVATEHVPALGGIDAPFEDLSSAEGSLRDALLALPWGDGSRHYAEPGYFANVHSSVRGFAFVLRNLQARPGERLLDLGADLTWSTSEFARRGLDCTAVDINHHLTTAHLFERAYGTSYDLIQADMTLVPFRDSTFDIIVGIDALHHGNDLPALARNIARMLAPGGRLGLVEPYCQTEAEKEAFGRAQIEAGINEHVHLLDEWHRAFASAGLRIRAHRIVESFAAVYEKPRAPISAALEAAPAAASLFDTLHDAHLTVLLPPPARVRPGEVIRVPVRVENTSPCTWWAGLQWVVRLTYHLYRAEDAGLQADAPGRAGTTAETNPQLVAWDNPRTALPAEIAPGDAVTVALEITAPQASGSYVAVIDLLQEFISWFADKGTEPARVGFSVI